MTLKQGELIIYQSEDGTTAVDVRLKDETVWLSQAQMQELFGRERSVITKHTNNVFKEGELQKDAVCAKFAHTASDGKTYQVTHYNLDVIISVGYRVKSQQGTRFRIWATSVLKDHLVKGYTLNRKRLAEKGVGEARQMLELLGTTLQSHDLVSDEGRAVLDIVNTYARTWRLLWQYDENALPLPKIPRKKQQRLPDLTSIRAAIGALKSRLVEKGEARKYSAGSVIAALPQFWVLSGRHSTAMSCIPGSRKRPPISYISSSRITLLQTATSGSAPFSFFCSCG